MRSIAERPGSALAGCLALLIAAALAPAGLRGEAVPAAAWGLWALTALVGLAAFRAGGMPWREGLRRIGWIAPFALVLAIPAAALAPAGRRAIVLGAVIARALAAAAMAAGTAAALGPAGLVEGARRLHLPGVLVDALAAALVALAATLRRLRAMLRALEARRTAHGPFRQALVAPAAAAAAFGRLAAALLLRSLERAEALERARRARSLEDA